MNVAELTKIGKEIRKQTFITSYFAGGGHMGAAFSVADILATLYFGDVMKYNSNNPDWEDRDFLVLSKGHAAFALYAALNIAGFIDKEELKHVCQAGSKLGGHPKIHEIPGVEASTGALGHGLSFGIGNAFADKVDKRNNHTYVILGDGECQEGSIWEGALSAPTLELNNLTVIVDHNKLQAMDNLENIVKMQPFPDKWKAFGWNVIEVDGHDVEQLQKAFLARCEHKPTLVVAHTTKGKGISFMEGVPIWHYRMPNEEELSIVLEELDISKEELGIK